MTKAGLGNTEIQCVKDKESADSNMAAIIDAPGNPSLSDAQKYVPVLLSCMAKSDFARVIVAGAGDALDTEQKACLGMFITSLSEADLIEVSAGTDASSRKASAACPSLGGGASTTPSSAETAAFKCSDIFVTETGKNDPTSISSTQLAVCGANLGASWAPAVLGKASWAVGDALNGFDVTVLTDQYTGSFTKSDALAACNAIAAYLATNNKSDWPLNIGTGVGTVSKPTTVLASKSASGTCQNA